MTDRFRNSRGRRRPAWRRPSLERLEPRFLLSVAPAPPAPAIPPGGPPLLDLNGPAPGADFIAGFTAGGQPVALADADAQLTDDSFHAELGSLLVTLVNPVDAGYELLAADTTGTGITTNRYDAATGVLTLAGGDSAEHYLQVLLTVTYHNASPSPDLTHRAVTVVASNGFGDSNTANAAVTIDPAGNGPTFADGIARGTVTADAVVETSGLAASRANDGVLWIHNDSGHPAEVIAVDAQGGFLGAFSLQGATNVDFEDIAIGPGPVADVDYLHVADIGDNGELRSQITVYRVPEPLVDAEGGDQSAALAGVDAITLAYPDGAHDAETLLVDPLSGDLYVITKRDAANRVYRLPAPAAGDQSLTLQYQGEMNWAGAVGGDVSPDGTEILVRGYLAAYLYSRPAGIELWDALVSPIDVAGAPVNFEPQGEAIGFDAAGHGYYTLSEGRDQPLYYYPRLGSLVDGTLAIAGSDAEDDTFEFTPGPDVHTVVLNDQVQQYRAADVDDVFFDGLGGADTVVFHGTAAAETVEFWPDWGWFEDDGVTVEVDNVEVLSATSGGGADRATLFGGAGVDTLTVDDGVATMAGPNVDYEATGFAEFYAYGRRGDGDVVHLYDGPGQDEFVVTSQFGGMYLQDYLVQTRFFDETYGYSDGVSGDTAKFYDGPGDDTFTSEPESVSMTGDYNGTPFIRQADDFIRVYAWATGGGHDVAHMNDGPGRDEFLSTSAEGMWIGAEGWYQRVKWFEETHAYTDNFDPEFDKARMYDGPNDDTFTANPTSAVMAGTRFDGVAYRVEAHDFDAAHAYAWDRGYDTAHFTDSPGADTYYGTPVDASMWDAAGTYWIRGKWFEEYNGRSDNGGDDNAILIDSAFADLFEAEDDWGKLSNAVLDLAHLVTGFGHVTVEGGGDDGDTKQVVDPLDYLLTIDNDAWNGP